MLLHWAQYNVSSMKWMHLPTPSSFLQDCTGKQWNANNTTVFDQNWKAQILDHMHETAPIKKE